MENIRNIKEKLISCVSCNEGMCPIIRERLEHHVLSHNATDRRSSLSKNLTSLSTMTSGSVITIDNSDEQTSTSDLADKRSDDRTNRSIYKKRLKETVCEWSEDLPGYQNSSAENLKQNALNDFIEKLNNMYSEVTEDYYDLNLATKIDKLIDSLPSLSEDSEDDSRLDRLKKLLLERIHNLNKNIINSDSTEESDTQEGLKYKQVQNKEKRRSRASLSDNNETESNKRHQRTNVDENIYKQIILDWIDGVYRGPDKNGKKIIADAILNRLRVLLFAKSTRNLKLLLKAKIFNTLNDNADLLSLSSDNYTQLNRLSEELAVSLLSTKFSQEGVYSMSYNSYMRDSSDILKPTTFVHDDHIEYVVENIVHEHLHNLDVSRSVEMTIVNIILKNIKSVCMRQDFHIEVQIFNILKYYTGRSDYSISSLTDSILDQTRAEAASKYLKTYNSAYFDNNFKTCGPSLISVYKSEDEIHVSNNLRSSFKRNSSENCYRLNLEDKKYVDTVLQLLKAWVTVLPIRSNKFENERNEETLIINLAYDILDQVKLEKLVPETEAEKEKYQSFFINRWLNRLNWFQNISEAQPYVENLIEKLQNIPTPSKNNNNVLSKEKMPHGTKEYSTVGEVLERDVQPHEEPVGTEDILKEIILKYIKHNYEEDNVIAREVFDHILKNELQKLSTPTRQEVYKNLHDKVDNTLAFEKISKELRYINIISDWLKTLPLDGAFNKSGNKDRAQYVNNLATIINNVEETRSKSEDYEQLKSSILRSTAMLSLQTQSTRDISNLIDNLISRIVCLRVGKCCGYENKKYLSLSIDSVPDYNLTDFIATYIRENSDEIEDDQLKLEAWSLRVFKEVDNMASENPKTLSTSQVYNRMTEISDHKEDLGKRFNVELSYAKEISDWLKHVPLQVNTNTKKIIVTMISNLAEKMAERWQAKNTDPNNSQVDNKLEVYIQNWILKLPIDRNNTIVLPIAIQQIWNIMEKVNTGKDTANSTEMQPKVSEYGSRMCESHNPCCNRNRGLKDLENRDPGMEIVDTIEAWCNNLPIQSDNELLDRTVKEELTTRLYNKISILNKNPDYFNNSFLYLQMLEDEIDSGLDNLPQTSQLRHSRDIFKRQILNKVYEIRDMMGDKAADVKYRQELEKTIEMSLPHSVIMRQRDCPGFQIYKNLLAQLFTLEAFDHGHDDFKKYCAGNLWYKIDNHFDDLQNMNTLSLNKEQMFNELYNALLSVPVPDEEAVVEEVEEIKTRCIIEDWFESLSMREATGVEELLEWDQMISMLAKRLHSIEKKHINPSDNIHTVIIQFVNKLPILSDKDNYCDNIANELQHRLEFSVNDRKCKRRDHNMSLKEFLLNKSVNKEIIGASQVAGPSADGKLWSSPTLVSPREFHQGCCKPSERLSDILLGIIETWCLRIPLPANNQQEKNNAKTIRDNLIARLIIKIGELSVNSEAFENDLLYDAMLDDELEDLMSTLPASVELQQNKNSIKKELKDSIKSVKYLIREERERYHYKQDLKNTTNRVLEHPQNIPPVKAALLATIREEIVDDFIVYSFYECDKEDRDVYKIMLQRAIQRYFVEKENITNDSVSDPLAKENQLLSELANVLTPSTDEMLKEINEILLKFELNSLLKELPIKDDENKLPLQNQIKHTLAKRLSNFTTDSFINNQHKIKDEIMKSLKILHIEIDPQKVDTFIKRLAMPKNTKYPQVSVSSNKNISLPNHVKMQNYTQMDSEQVVNNENNEEEQGLSLSTASPRVNVPNYGDTVLFKDRQILEQIASLEKRETAFGRSLNESEISYEKFKEGEALTSTAIRNNQIIKIAPDSNVSSANRIVTGTANDSRQSLRSPNADFIQKRGTENELRSQVASPQSHNPNFHYQKPGLSRAMPYPSCHHQYLSNQSYRQSRHISSDTYRNQMYFNATKYCTSSPLSSGFSFVPGPAALSKQSFVDPSISNFPPEPMTQFSSQVSSYSNSRCNKNCRRPSIILLSPPNMNSINLQNTNQNRVQCQGILISDEDENDCSYSNKRRKRCRGSPVCLIHMRKRCRVCNRPDTFRRITAYRQM